MNEKCMSIGDTVIGMTEYGTVVVGTLTEFRKSGEKVINMVMADDLYACMMVVLLENVIVKANDHAERVRQKSPYFIQSDPPKFEW